MGLFKKIFSNRYSEKEKEVDPYKVNSNFDNIIKESKDISVIKNKLYERNDALNKLWEKETELLNIGNEYYKNQNYSEAEKAFKQLIEIGSKRAVAKEMLIKVYKAQNDKNGISWIKEKIEEQLNDPVDYHYEKSKLNKLKLKYSSDLYTNDEIWSSFQKQLSSTKDFNQYARIRELMTEILLKEKKYKDAVYTIILAYRDEATGFFLMDIQLNSENYKRYFTKEYITGRIKRVVKKAKYEKLLDDIAEISLKQIINIPKDNMQELKSELSDLLNKFNLKS
jgi:lipopolysaccharide biosynthesis regulator YciM